MVPAGVYIKHFASDRRHMMAEDSTWRSPPPAYPCIVAADGALTHTLPDFLDMAVGQSDTAGRVTEEPEFLKAFS